MSAVAEYLGNRIVPLDHFPELKTLLTRILDTYKPIDVILYGSQARNEATDQSDWDLKIIVADDVSAELLSPMLGWTIQEGSGVFADMSCIRISDFQTDLGIANSAASHIVDEGIVIDIHSGN